MEAINKDKMDFLSHLGRHITQSTDDHRESAFLIQRLSVFSNFYSPQTATLQCGCCIGYLRSCTQRPRIKCSRSSSCFSF